MPDGLFVQATFDVREKVQKIKDFIKDNLSQSARDFYLFETPPKRVIKQMNKSLKESKLGTRTLLYFGWRDQSETRQEDGPFLNLEKFDGEVITLQSKVKKKAKDYMAHLQGLEDESKSIQPLRDELKEAARPSPKQSPRHQM